MSKPGKSSRLYASLAGLVGEGLAFRRVLQQIKQFRNSIPPEAQVCYPDGQAFFSRAYRYLGRKHWPKNIPLKRPAVPTETWSSRSSGRRGRRKVNSHTPIILAINRYLIKSPRGSYRFCADQKHGGSARTNEPADHPVASVGGLWLIGLAVLFVGHQHQACSFCPTCPMS